MSSTSFDLHRNHLGQLVMSTGDGHHYDDVFFVCAFPLTSPHDNIAIFNLEGQEVGWIDCLSEMPDEIQKIVEHELDCAKFIPEIARVISVSSFDMPSVWHVETNRGETDFILLKEEDIRNITATTILIMDSKERSFIVRDVSLLDKQSKKLLERFCVVQRAA